MSFLQRIFGGKRERAAWAPLYGAIVAEGRDPFWYRAGGVPDTIDGRFDLVAAVTALVLLRLEALGPAGRAPAVLLTETFVGQFDQRDWYYVSRDVRAFAFNMPRPSGQTVLHIRFDANGNVESVNRTGIELVANIRPSNDETPTLGVHRSLIEELFGNIGAVGQTGRGAPTTDNPN